MAYNPMSKEFQDECKTLGLTGRQLIIKYQKEGNCVEKGVYKNIYRNQYTDKELLNYMIQFYEDYGKVPVVNDFKNNCGYPSCSIYKIRFGSWSCALKLVGLDVDSIVKRSVSKTNQHKGRLAEIKVANHFRQYPIDLAGENCLSLCDGICPNGKYYDVKSSKFYKERCRWDFNIRNKYRKHIEIYYLLAFNEDWTELEYGWRIPGETVAKEHFLVGLYNNYKFNVENMKQYDITKNLEMPEME